MTHPYFALLLATGVLLGLGLGIWDLRDARRDWHTGSGDSRRWLLNGLFSIGVAIYLLVRWSGLAFS